MRSLRATRVEQMPTGGWEVWFGEEHGPLWGVPCKPSVGTAQSRRCGSTSCTDSMTSLAEWKWRTAWVTLNASL